MLVFVKTLSIEKLEELQKISEIAEIARAGIHIISLPHTQQLTEKLNTSAQASVLNVEH